MVAIVICRRGEVDSKGQNSGDETVLYFLTAPRKSAGATRQGPAPKRRHVSDASTLNLSPQNTQLKGIFSSIPFKHIRHLLHELEPSGHSTAIDVAARLIQSTRP